MRTEDLVVWFLGACFIAPLAVFVRRLWRVATDPRIAYRLGRKASVVGKAGGDVFAGAAHAAAHTAGRATGQVENVVEDVGR